MTIFTPDAAEANQARAKTHNPQRLFWGLRIWLSQCCMYLSAAFVPEMRVHIASRRWDGLAYPRAMKNGPVNLTWGVGDMPEDRDA